VRATLLLAAPPEYARITLFASSKVQVRFLTLNNHSRREIVMTDKTVRGRFVWHELMTPDTSAAHSFYSKTLGWKTQPSDQVADYSMFVAGGNPLGGSMSLPAGAPHWLAYIGTPNIEATMEQARELGAKIVKEVEEIPGMGKYAVLQDPQGAAFAIFSSQDDAGSDKTPKRGEFSWHELMTTDAKAALEFYTELFGWEKRNEHDMGPMGFYYLFGRNGQEIGGMFDKPADVPGGPAWLPYVRVKDVTQTVKKVKSAGGTLTNGPMEVPGGDWIAQFVDPHGAAFAVHTLKADVAASAQPNGQGAATDASDAADVEEEPEAPVAKPKAKPKPKAPSQKSVKPVRAAAKSATAKSASGKSAAGKKSAPAKSAAKKKGSAVASKQRAAAKVTRRPAAKATKKTSKGPVKKAAPVKATKGTKGAKAAKRSAARKPARKK
jgi:predicted enzyme related to lactoylglutathione lyase